ncbi:hypothetical protein Plim_1022 [Planctopirus limnophila DSM 3776]|uniref:Uncharacterized protein n=2 Tax=Planctopirus limnophila TaxID=120 RepID=D5ST97_PLAL2|nr:hypothetical protein Plim_1022 [Planctopirus limnophila DSM 3776]
MLVEVMSDRQSVVKSESSQQVRLVAMCALVLLAILARFIPHPPNFSPVGAVALFSGAFLTQRWFALLIPIAILTISDAFIGFHSLVPVVYGCFLINVLIGRWVGGHSNPLVLAGAALAGSIQFFLITNLANWWTYYPHTREGFLENYILAIPYFQNSVMSDLLFTTVLFGGWHFAESVVAGWNNSRQTTEV